MEQQPFSVKKSFRKKCYLVFFMRRGLQSLRNQFLVRCNLSLSLWLAVFVCCWPLPLLLLVVFCCFCSFLSLPFTFSSFCSLCLLLFFVFVYSFSLPFIVFVFRCRRFLFFSVMMMVITDIMMTMVSPDLESIDQVIPQTCQQPPKSLTSIHFGRCF